MKKIIAGVFAFGLVFSIAFSMKVFAVDTINSTIPVSVSINRTLNVGSKGEDVKNLQIFL